MDLINIEIKKDNTTKQCSDCIILRSAGGGTRTHTMSPPTDFESVTSTNSITPANIDVVSCFAQHRYYIIYLLFYQVVLLQFLKN